MQVSRGLEGRDCTWRPWENVKLVPVRWRLVGQGTVLGALEQVELGQVSKRVRGQGA